MKYDYLCRACQKEWEAEQKISDSPLKQCPECGSEQVTRLISSRTSFVLNGKGWFRDGY